MDEEALAHDTNEIVTALSRSLHEEILFRMTPNGPVYRTPNGLVEHLKSSCAGQQRNILLDAGFQAWFAYFSSEHRIREKFDSLQASERRDVARRICNIKPHPSVEKLYQHIFHGAVRAEYRRALLDKSGYSYPEDERGSVSGQASPDNTASSQVQNLGETHAGDHHTLGDADQPRPPVSHAHPTNSGLLPSAPNASPGFRLPSLMSSMHQGTGLPPLADHGQGVRVLQSVNDNQPGRRMVDVPPGSVSSLESPNAKNIPSLFSPHMCASIVTKNRAAAVRAFFTDAPLQCSLEVDIYSRRTPHIASELFGVIIDIENSSLTWKLDSGSSVSFETITLSGANRRGAEKLLGAIYTIISADNQFNEELDEGKPLTDLISLRINGNTGNTSCLKVRGDAHTISLIAAQLWPSHPHS